MNKPASILAVLDRSDTDQAVLTKAAERGGLVPETRHARVAALGKLAQECHIGSPNIHVLDGDPELTLPTCIADGNYDVIVLGALTHRPGAVTLVGTLTARLVDVVDCDFVLVKMPAA